MPNGIHGVMLSSSLLSSSLLLRSVCDHSVHRMLIGRASDSNPDARPIRIRCAAAYVPVDVALYTALNVIYHAYFFKFYTN
jgi:hypothetical protein